MTSSENHYRPKEAIARASAERFSALWRRVQVVQSLDVHRFDNRVARIYREVTELYGARNRYYHTLNHIDFCLKQLDSLPLSSEPCANSHDAIELAIWFHDVIYEASAKNNERLSADWFIDCAKGNLDPQLVAEVEELIMATTHSSEPSTLNQTYTSDIDLSSFGLGWPRFQEDSKNVRLEFSHLSDQEFAGKQLWFLQQLLTRPKVFYSDRFFGLYEHQARDNISRQIEILAEAARGET